MTIAGPCVVCGATDYELSFGGPDICPQCDIRLPETWKTYESRYRDGSLRPFEHDELAEAIQNGIRQLEVLQAKLKKLHAETDGGSDWNYATAQKYVESTRRRADDAEASKTHSLLVLHQQNLDLAAAKAELADAQHWRERHCRESQAYAEQSQKNWSELQEMTRLRDLAVAEGHRIGAFWAVRLVEEVDTLKHENRSLKSVAQLADEIFRELSDHERGRCQLADVNECVTRIRGKIGEYRTLRALG